MKALVCYLSYSGNTKEVAEVIQEELIKNNNIVDMYEMGLGIIPDLSSYDLVFLGTFTWDLGSTPDDTKDFVADVGYKPRNMVIFGTGDTQFGGDELFCHAVDKLHKFYESKYEPLKIEQSPRGYQMVNIKQWLEGVLNNNGRKVTNSESVGA